jgi:hypothetical protein
MSLEQPANIKNLHDLQIEAENEILKEKLIPTGGFLAGQIPDIIKMSLSGESTETATNILYRKAALPNASFDTDTVDLLMLGINGFLTSHAEEIAAAKKMLPSPKILKKIESSPIVKKNELDTTESGGEAGKGDEVLPIEEVSETISKPDDAYTHTILEYLKTKEYSQDALDEQSIEALEHQAVILYAEEYLQKSNFNKKKLAAMRIGEQGGLSALVTEASNLIREKETRGNKKSQKSKIQETISNAVQPTESVGTDSVLPAETLAEHAVLQDLVEKMNADENNASVEPNAEEVIENAELSQEEILAIEHISTSLFRETGDKPENIRYVTLALEKHPELANETNEDAIWDKVQMVIMREELMNSL